jgi:hypothetical protein
MFGLSKPKYEEIRRAVKYSVARSKWAYEPSLAAFIVSICIAMNVMRMNFWLQNVIETSKVKIINGSSDDKLDYDNYADGLEYALLDDWSV